MKSQCENCRDRKIKCTGPSRSDGSCTGCINKSSHYPDCQFMRVRTLDHSSLPQLMSLQVQCTELIFVEPGKSDSRAGEPVTYESVRAILGKASKNGEDDRRSSVCQEERYLSSSPQHSAPPDSTEVAPVCSPPGTWAPIVPTYAVSSCPVSASHLAEYTPSYNTYEERVPSAIVADQSERRLPSLMSSLNGDLHVQNWTSQGPNQSRTTTYHPSPWTRQILPDISVASAWDSPLRALHYRSQPIMLHPLTNTSAPSTAVAESYSPCKTSFCLPAMSAATLGSDTMVAPIAPMGYGWRSGDWSAGQWMEQDATADADVMSQGYEPAMCGAFHAGSGSAVGQAGWREV